MNLIEQIPLNTDTEGNCSCLKANYYKMGGANFIGHTKDGFKATCIMEVIQIGNIVDDTDIGFKNPQRGRVYSSDGLCPCLCDGSGGGGREPKIVEPISCAMRGRNPDNPSERKRSNGKYKQRIEMGSNISNTITSVQKDSLVAEPNVLTPKRTEFGKQVRKQYEAGEIDMSRHDMTELVAREDGISNTLTSVQKDNYLAIPEATAKGYAEATEGDSVNLEQPSSKTRRGIVGKQMANTLTTSCNQGVVIGATGVVEDWQTVVGNKQLNPFRGSVEGISHCITSACGAGGGMTPMLTDADLEITKTKEFIEQVRGHEPMRYRIRKLTPRECFRLMGVTETDIDKIQQSGVSQSQQYKMAGNSIVCDVLYHIFRKLLIEKENENQQLTLF